MMGFGYYLDEAKPSIFLQNNQRDSF